MQPIEEVRDRLSTRNPSAPPDRRYQLAKKLLKYGAKPSVRDDDETWQVYRCLRLRHGALPYADLIRLRGKYRDLFDAMDLHHGRERCLRRLVEAYILGRADDSSIAARVGGSAARIYWFRLMFYDVENFLDAPIRVIHQLIGVVDADGRSTLNEHAVWKLVAYRCGAMALDQLFGIGAEKHSVEGVAPWLERRAEMMVRIKSLLAAGKLDTNNVKHLEALLKSMLESQRSRQTGEESRSSDIEKHIEALVEEIPWTVGESGENLLKGTKLGEIDASAVEAHDDEVMLLASGKELPGYDELLKMKLPAPRAVRPTLERPPTLGN